MEIAGGAGEGEHLDRLLPKPFLCFDKLSMNEKSQ